MGGRSAHEVGWFIYGVGWYSFSYQTVCNSSGILTYFVSEIFFDIPDGLCLYPEQSVTHWVESWSSLKLFLEYQIPYLSKLVSWNVVMVVNPQNKCRNGFTTHFPFTYESLIERHCHVGRATLLVPNTVGQRSTLVLCYERCFIFIFELSTIHFLLCLFCWLDTLLRNMCKVSKYRFVEVFLILDILTSLCVFWGLG